jgi:hypothetical protein
MARVVWYGSDQGRQVGEPPRALGVRLIAVLAYEGRQLPMLVGGPRHIHPRRLAGTTLYKTGLLRIPGLHPRQRPLSGSVILIIVEMLDSV